MRRRRWRLGSPPSVGLPPTFASLAYREYRCLWLSTALANSGRWVLALGVGWLLYSLTQSSSWVGASLFTIQAPALLVAPLAGMGADRYDRRLLLAASLTLSVMATATLALLTALHLATPPLVLACTLACGVAFSVQGTVGSALVPGMVPRAQLPNAVALLGTVRQGAEFLGPALGSGLLVAAGPAAVLGLACLCYAAAVALALALRYHRPTALSSGSIQPFARLWEGVRYIRGVALLGSIIVLVGFHCSLTMTYQGMLPQFAKLDLGGDGQTYGSLMSAVGLGAIVGTLGLASIGDRRWHSRGYLITAAASGAALLALGLLHHPTAAIALAVVVGAAQASFMAISLTFLQEITDDAFLGRVTGVYSFLASGTMAFASWGLGDLADRVAPGALMVGAGGLFVAVVIVALLRSPAFRQLYVHGTSRLEVGEAAGATAG